MTSNFFRQTSHHLLLQDIIQSDSTCLVEHERPHLGRGSSVSFGSLDDRGGHLLRRATVFLFEIFDQLVPSGGSRGAVHEAVNVGIGVDIDFFVDVGKFYLRVCDVEARECRFDSPDPIVDVQWVENRKCWSTHALLRRCLIGGRRIDGCFDNSSVVGGVVGGSGFNRRLYDGPEFFRIHGHVCAL